MRKDRGNACTNVIAFDQGNVPYFYSLHVGDGIPSSNGQNPGSDTPLASTSAWIVHFVSGRNPSHPVDEGINFALAPTGGLCQFGRNFLGRFFRLQRPFNGDTQFLFRPYAAFIFRLSSDYNCKLAPRRLGFEILQRSTYVAAPVFLEHLGHFTGYA